MFGIKLPGLVVGAIFTVVTGLSTYFSAGGAGFEWAYAPVAVAVLGIISAAINASKPTVEPSAAASRGEVAQPESKWRKFLLG